MKEDYTFFWSGPFSQWAMRNMVIDGLTFNCCEQYMMYRKAILFGDIAIAREIMESNNPSVIKMLGRAVANFDEEVWIRNREDIVFTANWHKFTQHDDLKEILLESWGTTLVEASPLDDIWGIGLAEDNPRAWNESTWEGLNLLGFALTKVRDRLVENNLAGTAQ